MYFISNISAKEESVLMNYVVHQYVGQIPGYWITRDLSIVYSSILLVIFQVPMLWLRDRCLFLLIVKLCEYLFEYVKCWLRAFFKFSNMCKLFIKFILRMIWHKTFVHASSLNHRLISFILGMLRIMHEMKHLVVKNVSIQYLSFQFKRFKKYAVPVNGCDKGNEPIAVGLFISSQGFRCFVELMRYFVFRPCLTFRSEKQRFSYDCYA
jgi:hypothetical protein